MENLDIRTAAKWLFTVKPDTEELNEARRHFSEIRSQTHLGYEARRPDVEYKYLSEHQS
jgi:hypothetical protein